MTISNKFPGDISYFTPAQDPPAGTPLDLASAPTLYKPLQMRGIQIHNRIGVSPMGMYSAGKDGHATDFHLVHLGQFALKGAGLVFIETTAVEPRGRWSLYDVGLWNDDQIAPIKRIANFIHSQGFHMGIQIAHAGDVGGWPDDVVGPSSIPWADDHAVPKQLTVQEIKEQIQRWKDTAVRAIKAGIDILEIHASHGALLNNFLSPVTNKRTDAYGGSFENRTRFLFEVIESIRQAIPASTPLWVRLSATDWLEYTGEPSWDIESSIRLAKLLPAAGVDVLDVTTGGNAAAQRIEISQTFQTDIAGRIRDAVRADGHNLLIAAVGLIRDGRFARSLVQEDEDPKADIALVARQFLREADLVLSMAHELDFNVKWPIQYHRAPPKPTGRPI